MGKVSQQLVIFKIIKFQKLINIIAIMNRFLFMNSKRKKINNYKIYMISIVLLAYNVRIHYKIILNKNIEFWLRNNFIYI